MRCRAFRYFHATNTMKTSWGETIVCLHQPAFRMPPLRIWPTSLREDSWGQGGWETLEADSGHAFFSHHIVKTRDPRTAARVLRGELLALLYGLQANAARREHNPLQPAGCCATTAPDHPPHPCRIKSSRSRRAKTAAQSRQASPLGLMVSL